MAMTLAACSAPAPVDGGTGGGSEAGGGIGGGMTGTGGGGTVVAPIPLASYCTESRDTICSYVVRCLGIDPTFPCSKLFERQPDCLYEYAASLDAGYTRYDGAAAQRCLATLRTTQACPSIDIEQPCADAFIGTIAANEPCISNEDCLSGLWCDSTALRCPGICQPKVGVGDTATSSLACPGGTYLSSGRCRARPMLGEKCTHDDGGFDLACTAGAFCPYGNSGRGQNCLPLLSEGERCYRAGECGNFNDCVAMGDAGSVCTARSQLGEPCHPARAGMSRQSCRDGLACSTLDGGVCESSHASGGACTTWVECQAGLSCRNNVCGARLPVDGVCADNIDCQDGLVCADKRCTAGRGRGQSCNTPQQVCAEPFTCTRVDAGFGSTCLPRMCAP